MKAVAAAVGAIVLVAVAGPFAATALPGVPTPASTSSASVTVTIPAATTSPTPSPSVSQHSTGGGSGGGGGGGGEPSPGPSAPPACLQTDADGKPAPPVVGSVPSENPAVAQVTPASAALGSQVTVTAQGFRAGENVQLVVYSAGTVIDSETAKSDGTLTMKFTIPDDMSVGDHTVQLTGWTSCIVAAGPLFVVSAATESESWFPWIVWVVVGSTLLLVLILIFAARLLGWLPFSRAAAPAAAAAAMGAKP